MPRTKEVYDGKTWTAEQERIKHALDEHAWLMEKLDEEWCQQELLFSERRPRREVHPLFFHLGSSLFGDHRFIRDLRFFLDEMPKRFSGLIGKFKMDRDRQNTISRIYQLHAFCVLQRRGVICDWEPPTVGDKRADLHIPLSKGRELFLEAFTVFPMQDDRIHDEQSDWLRVQVNKIPNLAYMVCPWFQGCLTEKRAKFLLEAMKRDIASGELPKRLDERIERTYMYDDLPVAKVEYELSEDGEGLFSGPGQSTSRENDAAHIKFKLLDKLEKFQLPPRPALSGFLMCLETHWGDFVDVVDALKGNPKIAVTPNGQFRDIRDPNGVIHHEKGSNLANLDCIIVVEQPSNDWTRKNTRFLMNEQGFLVRDEVENLFFSKPEELP